MTFALASFSSLLRFLPSHQLSALLSLLLQSFLRYSPVQQANWGNVAQTQSHLYAFTFKYIYQHRNRIEPKFLTLLKSWSKLHNLTNPGYKLAVRRFRLYDVWVGFAVPAWSRRRISWSRRRRAVLRPQAPCRRGKWRISSASRLYSPCGRCACRAGTGWGLHKQSPSCRWHTCGGEHGISVTASMRTKLSLCWQTHSCNRMVSRVAQY